ncbi:hypothetical protein [Amycolatopsis sp. cmx-4-83]|uniref:hypothetical protein n=1 Tax=Amycolatopsis sp. cmx-4-83 TaxID=2790940 RepID=UPI0039792F52
MSQSPAEGFGPISYQVTLPLSRQTLGMVADLIRARRRRLRSRWRKAGPGGQALVVLQHDPRLADLGGGMSVSASTVRRWVLEAIALLAARASRLERVLRRLAAGKAGVVLVDGTVNRTRRRTGQANRANYSGKADKEFQGRHKDVRATVTAQSAAGYASRSCWLPTRPRPTGR